MPLYEFVCECKSKKAVLLPYDKYDQPQICECGQAMQHKISASTIWREGSTLVYTREGKGALAREMALDTLNHREGGFPKVNQNKKFFQQKAFEGV